MPTVTIDGYTGTSEDTSIGNTSWANIGFAQTPNLAWATTSLSGSGVGISHYIKIINPNNLPSPSPGYYNYINGVELTVIGYVEDGGGASGSGKSYSAKLLSNSTQVGTDLGLDAFTMTKTTSNQTYTIGDATEQWGCSQSELLDINGCVIAFYGTNALSSKEAYTKIDYLYLTVTYTETLIPGGEEAQKLARRKASFLEFLEDD